MTADTVRAERQDAINRAIHYLRNTRISEVLNTLGKTDLDRSWKINPATMVVFLEETDPDQTGQFFGAWKMAQKVLQAAGLPYLPESFLARQAVRRTALEFVAMFVDNAVEIESYATFLWGPQRDDPYDPERPGYLLPEVEQLRDEVKNVVDRLRAEAAEIEVGA